VYRRTHGPAGRQHAQLCSSSPAGTAEVDVRSLLFTVQLRHGVSSGVSQSVLSGLQSHLERASQAVVVEVLCDTEVAALLCGRSPTTHAYNCIRHRKQSRPTKPNCSRMLVWQACTTCQAGTQAGKHHTAGMQASTTNQTKWTSGYEWLQRPDAGLSPF
jgi:hypothetical protein